MIWEDDKVDRIKFYSENDLVCGWELDKIIDRIDDQSIEKEWLLEDVIEFFNILKYMQVERFAKYIEEKTNITSKDYIKKIKVKIGKFIDENKSVIFSKYDDVNYLGTEDFLEIIEIYRVYEHIPSSQFNIFLSKDNVPLYMVLKHNSIVDHFGDVVKDKIMGDSFNIEIILPKFLDAKDIYLPTSLREKDILNLIDRYIKTNSERIDINFLRKIIHFPAGRGLKITDKIKLHAKRREKEEVDKIFSQGSSMQSSVSVSYKKGLDEAIQLVPTKNVREVSIVVNRDWIEENEDYPTLWNNFIYLFGIVDIQGRLMTVSKKMR